jgi:broad-specificity NMP kinase
MWIIFLSGKMGTGKDTLANILQNKHGFKVYTFQTSLKIYSDKLDGMVKKDEKGRRLLQDVWYALRRYIIQIRGVNIT